MNSSNHRRLLLPLLSFVLAAWLGTTGITTAAEDERATDDRAAERYAERDPAGFAAPRQPITRRDYVDFVRPLAAGFEAGPNRGQYGPRPALPALAVFALEALDGSPLRVGGRLRALIVDGFSNHDWQQTTAIARRILEDTGRFDVSVSTSPPTKEAAGWDTWRPAFGAADVVILNCNSLGGRPTWPREVEVALEQYVRQGGGLYILHSANNAFPHWAEYDRMIGLGWRGKDAGYALTVAADGSLTRIEPGVGSGTSHGPRVDAVIHVLGQHPIHAGYPRAWKTPQAEIYTYARGPAEELTVLSYARDAQTEKNWPMEWVVKYGRGAVYNSTLGHVWAGDDDPDSTRCVGFRTTLVRAAQWLATGRVTWPVPADFPTQDAVSCRGTRPKGPDVNSPR